MKIFNLFFGGIKKNISVAEMISPFDKIAVALEPLGIQNFVTKPYLEILSKNDCVFTEFDNDIFPYLEQAYKTDNYDIRVNFLDEYFLSRLNDFRDNILGKSLKLIDSKKEKFKVNELAVLLGISQKTLNRKFKKELNCTVKEYLEIAQFRKSFNHFLNQEKTENLTQLAQEFDYYDQSEFIRQFKKISGINPKKLFKNVEQFGNENIFWGK